MLSGKDFAVDVLVRCIDFDSINYNRLGIITWTGSTLVCYFKWINGEEERIGSALDFDPVKP